MLTAKRFADEIGKPYSTVALWLKDSRIPEAETHELEGEKIFYLIPASVVEKYKQPENHPKRGRPKTQSITDDQTGEEDKSVNQSEKPIKDSKKAKKTKAKK